jgi:hypothetical protein
MHRFNRRHVGSRLSYVSLGSGMEPNGVIAARHTWHADKADTPPRTALPCAAGAAKRGSRSLSGQETGALGGQAG